MDSEYLTENEDNTLNKKWKNIKSTIKNAADTSLTTTEKKVPRKEQINKKIVKLTEERRKYKTKTLKKNNKEITIREAKKSKKSGCSSN